MACPLHALRLLMRTDVVSRGLGILGHNLCTLLWTLKALLLTSKGNVHSGLAVRFPHAEE